ncbi:Ig-like domain-containing protein [Saccharibacillus alkalitolerans]|uniref:SLH domain-containing protein n=1 Tax=Saccharibacillus alkalitolerans TaxID=2705290 RepID=A0ABX0F987_9BACL|nr:Ig-like domain-containing protein [Saccharibacillus alkalitolerans]NGZ76539.1 hypothetical protein [Saccharibacillus alkalitolerans]
MRVIQKVGTVLSVGCVLIGLADSAALNKVYAAPPTATLVVSNKALKIGDTSTLTITFSEAVSGFSVADLTSTNVLIGEPSSTDGGTTWTAALTPYSDVEASAQTVTLDNTGVMNSANESNTGKTVSDVFAIDTLRPTLASSIAISDTALKAGDSATVTFVFKEAVTGFTEADLTVPNGTVGGLSSSDGGITWTATLTPKANVASKSNTVVLENAAIIDLAGNHGTGTTSSDNYEVQTVVPTAAVTVADSTLTAGKTSSVKIVFTEAVTGLAIDDFTVDNGTLSGLASSDGGITWTAVLTPASDTDAEINRLSLRNEGFVSAAGNAGAGTTVSNAYAVKTVTPSGGEPSPPPVSYASPISVPVDQVPGNALIVSNDGTLTLPAGRAGTVNLGDAIRVEVPAGAAAKELKLSINRVTDTRNLLNNGEILASPVFELFKSLPENLDKPVKLSLSFDPAAVTGDRKAAVFFYDETRKAWTEIKGGTLQGNRMTVDVDRFAKYAVLAAETPKTALPGGGKPQDIALRDISGHWSEAAVKQAIGEGFVSGYPDGTFRPDAIVTRAEYALVLMNVLNGHASGAAVSFTDASEIGAWAQTAVSQAVQLGILTGYADGSVRPNAGITRAEMAVMAARALKLSAGSGARTSFSDDSSIPVWAKDAAEVLKKAGVIQGTGANTFKAAAETTRAEAVTLLMNLRKQQE